MKKNLIMDIQKEKDLEIAHRLILNYFLIETEMYEHIKDLIFKLKTENKETHTQIILDTVINYILPFYEKHPQFIFEIEGATVTTHEVKRGLYGPSYDSICYKTSKEQIGYILYDGEIKKIQFNELDIHFDGWQNSKEFISYILRGKCYEQIYGQRPQVDMYKYVETSAFDMDKRQLQEFLTQQVDNKINTLFKEKLNLLRQT